MRAFRYGARAHRTEDPIRKIQPNGDVSCAPKLGRLKLELRHQGLVPELLRGQSLQFSLAPPRAPTDDIGVEADLERLEVGPLCICQDFFEQIAILILSTSRRACRPCGSRSRCCSPGRTCRRWSPEASLTFPMLLLKTRAPLTGQTHREPLACDYARISFNFPHGQPPGCPIL